MKLNNNYNIKIGNNQNTDIEKFIQENGTVYHQYEFLKNVGTDYKYLVVYNVETIIGVFPYVKSSKFGIISLNLPPYIYIYDPVIDSRISVEEREGIINLVIKELLKYGRVDLKTKNHDDLILYNNAGFIINESQTFVIKSKDAFGTENLNKSKKAQIKQFEALLQSNEIKIYENEKQTNPRILELWKKTGQRAKFNPRIDILKNIVNSNITYYSNLITDKNDVPLAGTFCPYDKHTMYHLVSASNRELEKPFSSANILSLYKAILKSQELILDFDFEGSNIKGVAAFYKSMGGKKQTIYSVQKDNSLYYKIAGKLVSK